MNTIRSRSAWRVVVATIFPMTAVLLVGCASLPADEAIIAGNPDPVADLIYAGKIGPDDLLETYDGFITPLCAIVASRKQAAAVDQLLKAGADINAPCRTGGSWVNEKPFYSLDNLMQSAIGRGTQKSPYGTQDTYSLDHRNFLMKRIEYFLSRGATSSKGALTFSQVAEHVAKETGSSNVWIDEQKKKLADEKKDSWLTAETLGAVVAVAGGAVNNYAAAKNSTTGTAQRPSTVAQISSPRPAAQARTTTSKETPTRAVAAQNELDVIESNPYEKYATEPNSWGYAINGWLGVQRYGTSRTAVCSAVMAAQTKWIADDESKGYVTASGRSGCICGTYRSMGNVKYATAQWTCGAYHKVQDTGKKRNSLAR